MNPLDLRDEEAKYGNAKKVNFDLYTLGGEDSVFPEDIDTFTIKHDGDIIFASHVNKLQNAIHVIENSLGIDLLNVKFQNVIGDSNLASGLVSMPVTETTPYEVMRWINMLDQEDTLITIEEGEKVLVM